MASMNSRRKPKQLSETQLAGANWIKVAAFLIIVAVVIYSEYMFIGIVSVILPDGINRIAAVIGAVATGASVLALIGAKLFWISPGSQLIMSWIFTGVEIAVLMLNDMLAYALHYGAAQGPLAYWQQFTSASPVIALIGWILILFLDTAQRERHKDLELAAKKAKSERDYIEVAHEAEMELRHTHLDQVTARLQDVLASDQIQQQIMNHAERMVARVLTDVSGINAVSGGFTSISPAQNQQAQLPAPKPQTEELQAAALAQTDSVEPVEDKPSLLQSVLNLFKQQPDDVGKPYACSGGCGKIGVQADWKSFPEAPDYLYCPFCYQVAQQARQTIVKVRPDPTATRAGGIQCSGCGLIGDGIGWRFLGNSAFYCPSCDSKYNPDGTPKKP